MWQAIAGVAGYEPPLLVNSRHIQELMRCYSSNHFLHSVQIFLPWPPKLLVPAILPVTARFSRSFTLIILPRKAIICLLTTSIRSFPPPTISSTSVGQGEGGGGGGYGVVAPVLLISIGLTNKDICSPPPLYTEKAR